MAILIKRYANRKLYNTDTSRYITLKGIAKLLEEGEEVRVMDNETGEDITQIALSQILVDNKRANEDPSDTLLSQILSRGGDALYGAIRKSVDDATDGLGDFQERLRRIVNQSESLTRPVRGFGWDARSQEDSTQDSRDAAGGSDDHEGRVPEDAGQDSGLEALVRKAVGDAIEAYDLSHRKEIESMAQDLERIAIAVERLESATRRQGDNESR
jgi:polyhydroxyalkanoate synthesis repressor PhaR